ncbi:hypothetical protein BD311DRAFT_758742 [Dichomitus squalens]|uniref:Uncharacterized protein n=1 Tax=Dichomitus squalens TaxID=114155 RepID=A0A4Q9MPZ0_9APHY|nr:hypothetical protein BD311DRAFT_758742 [Dichomitus squalens]
MLAYYVLVALVSPLYRPSWAGPSTSPPAPARCSAALFLHAVGRFKTVKARLPFRLKPPL